MRIIVGTRIDALQPEWSTFYAPGLEIRAYLERVVEKYGLGPYLKLQHELVHARYDEAQGKWHLRIRRPGQGHTTETPSYDEFEDTADLVFCGAGGLSRWSWPDIEGLKDFKGKLMHSADWDTDDWREGVRDWKDKTVGVIGVVRRVFFFRQVCRHHCIYLGLVGHSDGTGTPAVCWKAVQFRSGKDLAGAPIFCRDAF